MGIREDTHLKGQEYVRSLFPVVPDFPDRVTQIRLADYLWYTSCYPAYLRIFTQSSVYIAILAWEFPTNRLLQRLPMYVSDCQPPLIISDFEPPFFKSEVLGLQYHGMGCRPCLHCCVCFFASYIALVCL